MSCVDDRYGTECPKPEHEAARDRAPYHFQCRDLFSIGTPASDDDEARLVSRGLPSLRGTQHSPGHSHLSAAQTRHETHNQDQGVVDRVTLNHVVT